MPSISYLTSLRKKKVVFINFNLNKTTMVARGWGNNEFNGCSTSLFQNKSSKDLLHKNMNTLDTAELIHLKMVKTINVTLKKF